MTKAMTKTITKTKKLTMAQKALKWMHSDEGRMEYEIRDRDDCINTIWRKAYEMPGYDEDEVHCSCCKHDDDELQEEYWLDVFKDGSAVEVSSWGEVAISAEEAKEIAGDWEDWKEAIAPFLK